jgi:hypothetical protein
MSRPPWRSRWAWDSGRHRYPSPYRPRCSCEMEPQTLLRVGHFTICYIQTRICSTRQVCTRESLNQATKHRDTTLVSCTLLLPPGARESGDGGPAPVAGGQTRHPHPGPPPSQGEGSLGANLTRFDLVAYVRCSGAFCEPQST